MGSTFSIGTELHGHAGWLGRESIAAANEALSAHEQGEYVTAASRAGVSLEGVLKRMLEDWDEDVPSLATLGPLIKSVSASGRAPAGLLKRLDEAREIRNRASHDKSSGIEQVSEADSLLILHVLRLAVTWYAEEGRPPGGGGAEGQLRVFLSTGTPHCLEQLQFLESLRAEMAGLGVGLHNVPPDKFKEGKPLDHVRELMTTCRAALVVGLERARVYTVSEREKPVNQDRFIPTPWNQIEGGIATALRLPILVLRDARLHREGIFEDGKHDHQIRNFELANECRRLSPDLRRFLAGWVEYLQKLSAGAR